VSQLLHGMLSQAAAVSPERIAFTDGKTSISYRDLDIRSNRLANLLIERGLQLGDRVAVFMPRCSETAVAFYGILKSGGIVDKF